MDIHVGNLAREVTEAELRQAFEPFGQVAAVKIVRDRNSISKGFGFIEMTDVAEARAAIAGLNRKQLAGHTLDITEASSSHQRKNNRSYGGRGSGGKRRK
jgi:RNA recognition motif-containing protein